MWHCAVVTDYLMFVSQQREQLIIYKMKVVLIAILAAIAFSLNEAVPGKKTLVILEKMDYKTSHSLFFANLVRNRCYESG